MSIHLVLQRQTMKTLFKPNIMKYSILTLVFSLLMSCNTKVNKEVDNTKQTSSEALQNSNLEVEVKKDNTGTFLCKINGKDWSYTKASGIISMEGKPRKRTAIITFKKKLKKGSESIQLYYNADSSELITASMQLRFKNKEEKLFTCYYYLDSNTKKRNPNSKMSGVIDLSNLTTASGTATVSNMNIKYEGEKLGNPENATLNLTDLTFSGVGYSDIAKLAKAYKN